jgi:hypothetical protein
MPAPAVAVAADVNAALLAGYAAYEDIDSPSPDFASAGTHLDDAADALDDAAAGVAGLAASKAVSSAAKHIAKAAKGLPKAQDQVDGQDAKKGMKSLEKMGRSLIEAALLLNPQPLP